MITKQNFDQWNVVMREYVMYDQSEAGRGCVCVAWHVNGKTSVFL